MELTEEKEEENQAVWTGYGFNDCSHHIPVTSSDKMEWGDLQRWMNECEALKVTKFIILKNDGKNPTGD